MFSQACVKNSIHRERLCIPKCNGLGGVSVQGGGVYPGEVVSTQGVYTPSLKMTIEAGGMHQIVGHSCFNYFLLK